MFWSAARKGDAEPVYGEGWKSRSRDREKGEGNKESETGLAR